MNINIYQKYKVIITKTGSELSEEKEKLNKEAKEKNTTLSLLVRAKLFKNKED